MTDEIEPKKVEEIEILKVLPPYKSLDRADKMDTLINLIRWATDELEGMGTE